ncbi:LysR family transcriptional regulator [Acrocarpospora pleiomorpha]|uniref:LysR family transcriptional regulator n=1 Tax=Acrocarpospora pleiomorpha TaxID=90975 RepID=A0A5M3XI05_9ACTN|nr:LysR family transcriptional regulator [Acrocarpospora pleiomorpha]GES20844.1 LysR family transcriptional regulator [Acrocarpospora pleiomorpha]
MEIRQIQYFTTIVREGSFSRAARKLHVGQPALSKQIRSLERELGADLLVRLPEGVRPTVAGSRLDEMSQTLLNYVDDIRSAIREAAASVAGNVTLGLSPSLVPALAGYLEERFAADYPQVRIKIVEALPMFLGEWLEEGRLDLGIFTHLSGHATSQLSFADVGSDEMLLVGAKGMLSGLGEHATPGALQSLRLVLTPGFRDLLNTSAEFERVSQGIGSGVDSIHMVRDLVVRGEYCSVLPYTFIRGDLASGIVTAVGFAPVLERKLVAVTRAGRQPPPAVRAVIDVVRTRLGQLANLRGADLSPS